MMQSRRSFLRALGTGAVIIPLSAVSFQVRVAAANIPELDPNDATAQALGYTHAAPNPSKSCSDCQLYKGSSTAKWGRCAVFPGKRVNAKGWCASWSA